MPPFRSKGPGGGRPRPPRKPPSRRPAPPRPDRGPRADAPDSGQERLQKVLAHAGLGSRRACEEFILQGRVTVDGQVVRELGSKVDPVRQKIAVDGQTIRAERNVYYAVNKPKGYVSTNNDPSGRPRVVDLLPEIPERVYSVGRLDEASVGLMILTNDGELANRLAHPRFGVEKVYRGVVAGSPAPEVLDKLVEGVWLAEGKVRAKRARIAGKQGDATILEMVLAEGKNREVRRMLARLGHKVMSLTRVRIGPITVAGLRPGQWRRLTEEEVRRLQDIAAGLPDPGAPEPTARREFRPARPGPGPRAGRRMDRGAPPAGAPAPRGPAPAGRRPPGPGHGPRGRAGGPGPRPAAGPGGRPPGPAVRRPVEGPPPPPGGPLGPRRRPPMRDEPPQRKIIGMEGPGPRAAGPPPRRGRRPFRPGQRAPVLRRPRRGGGSTPAPDESAE